jgi:Glycosyl transferase family 2
VPDELIFEQEHDIPAPPAVRKPERSGLVVRCHHQFNGGVLVGDTIASIKAMDHPPEEILLVDDGSTDHSVERVAVARSASTPEFIRALTRPTIVVCEIRRGMGDLMSKNGRELKLLSSRVLK